MIMIWNSKQIYVCTRTGPNVEKTKEKILRLPMTTIRISPIKACTRISKMCIQREGNREGTTLLAPIGNRLEKSKRAEER